MLTLLLLALLVHVEIVEQRTIPSGIEVFARAWNENGQIGFGPDGTVDIERFKIFNQRYGADNQTAILADIEHAILVKKEKFGHERIDGDGLSLADSIKQDVAIFALALLVEASSGQSDMTAEFRCDRL